MASLVKLRRLISPFASKNTGYLCNIVRTKVYTNEDWKPGPYPRTEEERKKAAEKYGLTVEEYEPYPDDGNGYGDYPRLPLISAGAKDPFYPWDNPAFRRNYNETIHIHDNLMGLDRADMECGLKPNVEFGTQLRFFFGALIISALLFSIPWGHHHPVMEKQYPKEGKVHYTFEPAH